MKHKEDVIAREMARLVHSEVVKISAVQNDHTARLVRLEAGMTDLSDKVTGLSDKVAGHDARFDRLEDRIGGVEDRLGGVESTLTEVLRRLPEPPSRGDRAVSSE